MKTEKDLQKFITRYCKQQGVFCQKTESRSARGFPDLMLARDGLVLFMELKTPAGTGRLSALQLKRHREMRAAGLRVEVVACPDEAVMIIDILAGAAGSRRSSCPERS